MTNDDCDTINGHAVGRILIVYGSLATITFKDGTGNLYLNGDFASDSQDSYLVLMGRSNGWTELSRCNA